MSEVCDRTTHCEPTTYFDQLVDRYVRTKGINIRIFYITVILVIVIIIIIVAELSAYLWHRYMSHHDVITSVRRTHLEHHMANWLHEAHSDFGWIVIGLIIFIILLVMVYYLGLAPAWILLILASVSVVIAVWNWYIHVAYHQPGHWLERFDWFRYDRQMHLIHHVTPRKNYGIASHFSDWLLNTYESANTYVLLYPTANIVGVYKASKSL